jgi:hypothetical protein
MQQSSLFAPAFTRVPDDPFVGSGAEGHLRVGFSALQAPVAAPCGTHMLSFAYRDVGGEKVNRSISEHYGSSFSPGDVIGCLIHLPADADPVTGPAAQVEALVPGMALAAEGLRAADTAAAGSVHGLLRGSYVSFFKNGECQGTAFTDLPRGTYFPTLSLYMHARATANFGPDFEYPPVAVCRARRVRVPPRLALDSDRPVEPEPEAVPVAVAVADAGVGVMKSEAAASTPLMKPSLPMPAPPAMPADGIAMPADGIAMPADGYPAVSAPPLNAMPVDSMSMDDQLEAAPAQAPQAPAEAAPVDGHVAAPVDGRVAAAVDGRVAAAEPVPVSDVPTPAVATEAVSTAAAPTAAAPTDASPSDAAQSDSDSEMTDVPAPAEPQPAPPPPLPPAPTSLPQVWADIDVFDAAFRVVPMDPAAAPAPSPTAAAAAAAKPAFRRPGMKRAAHVDADAEPAPRVATRQQQQQPARLEHRLHAHLRPVPRVREPFDDCAMEVTRWRLAAPATLVRNPAVATEPKLVFLRRNKR